MTRTLKVATLIGMLLAGCAGADDGSWDEVSEVYRCAYEGGSEVLVVQVTRADDPASVFYDGGGSITGELMVERFYAGYWVLGIRGRHSPALTFRLEVFRPESGADFEGFMWELGASSATPVVCTHAYID